MEVLKQFTEVSRSTGVVISVVVLLMTFYFLFPFQSKRKGKTAPIPSGHLPFIGHLLKLDQHVFLDFFTQSWVEHGGSFELSVLGKRMLVITEWDSIKDVLSRRPKEFTRGVAMENWGGDMRVSDGLFNIEGAKEWGRIRRLTSPSFAPHQVDDMASVITNECEALLHRLDALLLRQNDNEKEGHNPSPINSLDVCMQFTLNVIVNLAFGSAVSDTNYLRSPDFLLDMKSFVEWIYRRLTIPLPPVVWRIYNDSLEQRAMHTSRMLEKSAADIRSAYDKNTTTTTTTTTVSNQDNQIKSMFLTTLVPPDLAGNPTNGRNHLSDSEISAQIKTFLIAGTETTAVTIASALQYLCDPKHSVFAEALYEETKRVFGGARAPSSLEQLRDLHLVSAFQKEALRLRGPAPLIFAEVAKSQGSSEIKGGFVVNSSVSMCI